jgi:hypothetical protein
MLKAPELEVRDGKPPFMMAQAAGDSRRYCQATETRRLTGEVAGNRQRAEAERHRHRRVTSNKTENRLKDLQLLQNHQEL